MQPIRLAVAPSTPLTEIRELLVRHQVSGAPVVNEKGELAGVISQSDLVRVVVGDLLEPESDCLIELFNEERSQVDPLAGKTAGEIMSVFVIKVSPSDPVSAVARTMVASHIHRVIVTDGNKPVGIISSIDLIALLAE